MQATAQLFRAAHELKLLYSFCPKPDSSNYVFIFRLRYNFAKNNTITIPTIMLKATLWNHSSMYNIDGETFTLSLFLKWGQSPSP